MMFTSLLFAALAATGLAAPNPSWVPHHGHGHDATPVNIAGGYSKAGHQTYYDVCEGRWRQLPYHLAIGGNYQGYEKSWPWGSGPFGHFYTKKYPVNANLGAYYAGYALGPCGQPVPVTEAGGVSVQGYNHGQPVQHLLHGTHGLVH